MRNIVLYSVICQLYVFSSNFPFTVYVALAVLRLITITNMYNNNCFEINNECKLGPVETKLNTV